MWRWFCPYFCPNPYFLYCLGKVVLRVCGVSLIGLVLNYGIVICFVITPLSRT